jgi:hypothetical protein
MVRLILEHVRNDGRPGPAEERGHD